MDLSVVDRALRTGALVRRSGGALLRSARNEHWSIRLTVSDVGPCVCGSGVHERSTTLERTSRREVGEKTHN